MTEPTEPAADMSRVPPGDNDFRIVREIIASPFATCTLFMITSFIGFTCWTFGATQMTFSIVLIPGVAILGFVVFTAGVIFGQHMERERVQARAPVVSHDGTKRRMGKK